MHMDMSGKQQYHHTCIAALAQATPAAGMAMGLIASSGRGDSSCAASSSCSWLSAAGPIASLGARGHLLLRS